MGIEPKSAPGVRGAESNVRYVEGLDQRTRHRYDLALWGETWEELLENFRTRRSNLSHSASTSKSSLGHGGCSGMAIKRLPGFWASVRSLQAEKHHISSDLSRGTSQELARTAAVRRGREAFKRCMYKHARVSLDGPGAVEEFLFGRRRAPDDVRAAVQTALEACDEIWMEASRLGEQELELRFLARHRDDLETLRRRYAHVRDRMRADDEFVAFINAEGTTPPQSR